METIKIIMFMEFLAMFVCGVIHLITWLMGEPFNVVLYGVMGIVILIVALLAIYIFTPLSEWWFND